MEILTKTHHLSPATLEILGRLLDAVPPAQLREHLIEIYHTYLIHEHNHLPANFHAIATDVSLFISALRELDQPPDE